MTTFILIAVILLAVYIANGAEKKEMDHGYNAKYGAISDHCSRFNVGFAIGYKAFTEKLSYTNFFVSGPTGSGKSTCITIPCAKSISRGSSSVVYNDVSGELWERTSSYHQDKGYKVLRLNFADSQHSESFNPLLACKTIADIQKLSQIVVQNTTGEHKSDPFWENASIMLLSLMGRYLVFHQPPEMRTLQNLLRLIERFAVDGNSVSKLFLKTDEELLSAYKSMLVMGEKTLQSVIASARTSLTLMNDPEVCKTTATNSISIDELRKEKVAIYISNPLKDLRYFKPLSTLFFQFLFNFALSTIPSKKDRSIFFVIDEFSSMKFPDIDVTICNCRKYKCGLLLCVQDPQTLTARYGEAIAHLIITNCGIRAYLPGQPLHTCTELSKILGKYSYENSKGSIQNRELLTADEIRMLGDVIILVNNSAPIKYHVTPYYNSFWLSEFAKAKPIEVPLREVSNPPTIQFS